jgi:hypothetical protein
MGIARDAAMLPVLRARLQIARRRERRNQAELPVALDRGEASTPSLQTEERIPVMAIEEGR